jgi:rhodanese-related sulfurtransferase
MKLTLALLSLALSVPLAAVDLNLGVDTNLMRKPTPMSTPNVNIDPLFTITKFAEKTPHISLKEAARLQKRKNVVFVDGRARLEWEQSHVPGAIAMPLGEFDKAYGEEAKRLKKADIIISYCHGPGCRLSDKLADMLIARGHRNVAVFWGGFPEWKDAGLPLEDKFGRKVGLSSK